LSLFRSEASQQFIVRKRKSGRRSAARGNLRFFPGGILPPS